jgi:Domain of unknown function (DUF1844)
MSQSEQEQERDALEQMREQLASVPAGDLIAEAALSLVALAYVRLGLPPEEHERYRDLEAARLLIDALGGMLGAVQGRLGAAEPGLRDALAGLRMAYVEVADAQAAEPAEDAPAQAPPPEGPGIHRPSGLWVPGQD